MRKAIVLGAAFGKNVVLEIGTSNGKILAEAKDEWPSYKIWDFKEWRKRVNYITIVKDNEQVDEFGNAAYEMKQATFTILILCTYVDEKST